MVRPERLGVQLEDQIVRGVLHTVDLFQDHIPFGLEIALAQERAADEVGEDLDGEREIRVEDVGLVAGVVAAGEGVEAPAPDLELEGELLRACGARCP